jgi:hypothetical protein
VFFEECEERAIVAGVSVFLRMQESKVEVFFLHPLGYQFSFPVFASPHLVLFFLGVMFSASREIKAKLVGWRRFSRVLRAYLSGFLPLVVTMACHSLFAGTASDSCSDG